MKLIISERQETTEATQSGFNAMGQPISESRRQFAYDTCKEIGLNTETAWHAVSSIADALERDKPYEAMEAGIHYIDLTGVYRIMAVLLTA